MRGPSRQSGFAALCTAFVFSMPPAQGCIKVEGDRILGSDMARADAAYAALPAGFVAGFSPFPGTRRVLDARLLAGIARSHGIPLETAAPLCFERATRVLEESQLQPALERALGQGTRVEIVDFSRYPVPDGELRRDRDPRRGRVPHL